MAATQLKQHQVESEDDLVSKLSTKGLKVVEVYSDWCGMCKSVLPLFKKIRLDKDDESALMFLAVSANKCGTLDTVKEHEGRSEPLFLLFRNGQLKARIPGANMPLLSSSIYEFTPANADMDDLEENPFYAAKRADGGGRDGKHADTKHKGAKKK